MQILFKNPAYLYALSLVLIPIIIHLFNFKRYKTVYFSDISFLEAIKNKSKSTSQLKHLLVLLSRILFIIAFVIIFAQPFIPNNNTKTNINNTNISIYIDNSFSSSNENTNGKIIDQHKKKAISIASAFKKDTKFLLITNSLKSEHNRFVNYEQFINFVAEVNISPKSLDIKYITQINKDYTQHIADNKLFVISDFQNDFISNIDLQDTISNVTLIPTEVDAKNNILIDTCWFNQPFRKFNNNEKLLIRIKSFSKTDNNDIPLKLFINDSLRAIKSFNIEAKETKIVELNYKNTFKGIYKAELKIDDYPIAFDNLLFFNYKIKQNINILIIEENSTDYLSKLYETESYFKIVKENSKNISYSKFNEYDLILIDNIKELSSGLISQLITYYNKGGNIVFIPIVDNRYIDNYNQLLSELNIHIEKTDTVSTAISELNTQSFLLENIFRKIDNKTAFPRISSNYKINKSVGIEILIKNENNNPLILKKANKGNFYMFSFNATGIENINFIKSPIMLPVFYNIALNSVKANKLYYHLQNRNIALNYNINNTISIKNNNVGVDFIPNTINKQHLSIIEIDDNITAAETYGIFNKNKETNAISLNYLRNESNMNFKNITELQQLINDNKLKKWQIINANNERLTQTIKLNTRGKQLWYYFVILALIFITFEIILLRGFKK